LAAVRREEPAGRLLDDKQAASYLGVSRSYLRAQVAAGRIPRVQLPSVDGERRARLLRIDIRDLDRLVDSMKATTS